tara:strand:- start:635 stop:1048 length:414 start_codon:yes stop_codon:yes gene_type:complete
MWKEILKAFNEEDKRDIRYATVRYMLEDSSFQPVEGFISQNNPTSIDELYEEVYKNRLYPKFRMTKDQYKDIIMGKENEGYPILNIGDAMHYVIVHERVLYASSRKQSSRNLNYNFVSLIRDKDANKLVDYLKEEYR